MDPMAKGISLNNDRVEVNSPFLMVKSPCHLSTPDNLEASTSIWTGTMCHQDELLNFTEIDRNGNSITNLKSALSY